MGAFTNAFGNSLGSQGTRLNLYSPFKIPDGTTYLPVDTLTGWSIRRVGGDPVAALSVVDVDPLYTKMIGSAKAVRFVTGAAVVTENMAMYTPSIAINALTNDFLVWVRLVDGTGISTWDKALGLRMYLYTGLSDYFYYTLGAPSIEYQTPGWYAFSLTPTRYNSTVGSPNINNITKIGIGTSKAAINSPIIEIGMVALCPKSTTKAQICIEGDGGYASHKLVADLLTTHGMTATFYVNEETHVLSISELQAMQSNGHLIAAYIRDWNTTLLSGLNNLINLIKSTQLWLSNNGFGGGKYFKHGITAGMTSEAWSTIFPKYGNSCCFAMRNIQSKYHKTYLGRYSEISAANLSAMITLVNQVVADNGIIAILCHELAGADYTAFVDFVENTLVPLQNAGSIEVITVKQAFES